eukprot:886994-Rhodomonas_salina.1
MKASAKSASRKSEISDTSFSLRLIHRHGFSGGGFSRHRKHTSVRLVDHNGSKNREGNFACEEAQPACLGWGAKYREGGQGGGQGRVGGEGMK